MSGPCLCGDPYCQRCFNQHERRIGEIADESGVDHEAVRAVVRALAMSRLHAREDDPDTLWAYMGQLVLDVAGDMAADEAEQRAEPD